jgi:hypothetical protein
MKKSVALTILPAVFTVALNLNASAQTASDRGPFTPIPESHNGAVGGEANLVAGTVVRDLSDFASASSEKGAPDLSRSYQLDQGSIRWNLSTDGKTLSYGYDTGFVPSRYGPGGVCDFTTYSGWAPYGVVTFKIDGVQIASASLSTKAMGRTARGTCYMSGVYSTNGFPIQPGQFNVTGYMAIGNSLLASTSASLTVPACSWIHTGQPQYTARRNLNTDNLYTMNYAAIYDAQSLGYTNQRIAFKMPPVVDGYGALQRPFKRFFIGLPQYEHMYTTTEEESQFLLSFGYTPQGTEGWVYKNQKVGTVPLHRFGRFYSAITDLEHYFTTDRFDAQSNGMVYEGVVGYVCSN